MDRLFDIEVGFHHGGHKRIHNVESISTIRPQRTQEGFEDISELLEVPSSIDRSRLFVVSTDHVELVQTKLLRELSDTLVVHQRLARICKEALLLLRVLLAEVRGHAAAQYRVSFKLQTLVGLILKGHHSRRTRSQLRRLSIGRRIVCPSNVGRMNHRSLEHAWVAHSIMRQPMLVKKGVNVAICEPPIRRVVG